MPQSAFLFSIAGLSFTLVGFSALIAALGRDGQRTELIRYRLRQIPEMALASALVALTTLPLVDTTGSATTAIRFGAALALGFTVAHVGLLLRRLRSQPFRLAWSTRVSAVLIDASLIAVAIVALVIANPASYEWLLVLMLTRAAVAFVLALGDVMVR